MQYIRAIFKFFVFFSITIVLIPVQICVLILTKEDNVFVVPRIWHKIVCHTFQIGITTQGMPSNASHVLYVGNHLSYLDIPVLGTVLKSSFIAKNDVAGWPVFGFLAKLNKTVFISRNPKDACKEQKYTKILLEERKKLVLFAEGTSSDGKDVLPFKSSLFSIVFGSNHANLLIQPFTIVQMNSEDSDLYCWHLGTEAPLGAHLWAFAKSSGAKIKVIFHDPIKVKDFSDRKTLAKLCHDTVSKGLKDQEIKHKEKQ